MSRKSRIKNIANGILNSFISRNNSVNGYWGIGVLLKDLMETKTQYIELDIMNPLKNGKYHLMTKNYKEIFLNNMKNHNLKLNENIKFYILVRAIDNKDNLSKLQTHKVICELYYESQITSFSLDNSIKARVHNPLREMKSLRNYES